MSDERKAAVGWIRNYAENAANALDELEEARELMTDQNVGTSAQPPTVRSVETSATSVEIARALGRLYAQSLVMTSELAPNDFVTVYGGRSLGKDIRLLLDALTEARDAYEAQSVVLKSVLAEKAKEKR